MLSRGTVLVDPRAAIARLRDHLLPEPVHYVLELVRVAVAGGATSLSLENDTDDMVLTFDGEPLDARDLACLLDHLFSATDRRLRLLAIAVNTALGLRPHFVDLYTTRHQGPAHALARVRWRPVDLEPQDDTAPYTPPASVLLPRPENFPATGMCVHVRERFGAAVLREWLAPAPAETVLLSRRAVALRIPLLRDGAPLEVTPPPRALVSVPLEGDPSLRGTLALVPQGEACGAIELCELGVLLSTHTFEDVRSDGDVRWPLWLRVDTDALPTNASRSLVNLESPFGAALLRARRAALVSLVARALEALNRPQDPDLDALRRALAALLVGLPGAGWRGLLAPPARPAEALDEARALAPLLDAPLVPLASGTFASPRALAARASRAPLHVWRGRQPIPEDLAPWLGDVVWLRPGDPALARLLAPLDPLLDARPALEQARQAQARYARFLAHPPRAPRVDARAPGDVLRVTFSRGETEGELVVRRPRSSDPLPGALDVTAFLKGRPLGSSSLGSSPLPLSLAVGAPDLRARPAFDGVEPDDALERALERALDALLSALSSALSPESVPLPEGVALTDLGLEKLSPGERAALVRGALTLVLNRARALDACPARASDLASRHRALLALPAWPTTVPERWLSTLEAVAAASPAPYAVCFASRTASGARLDRRPVFQVEGETRAALSALLPPRTAWVDCTRWLPTRRTEDLLTILPLEALTHRDLGVLRTTVEGVRAAALLTSGEGRLYDCHSGAVLSSRSLRAGLAGVVVAVEDDALLPGPEGGGVLTASLSRAARRIVHGAGYDLAEALARAARGDRDAAHSLSCYAWFGRRRPPVEVVRFLLGAITGLRHALGARAGARKLKPEDTPGAASALTASALLELLESTPIIEVCEGEDHPTLRSVGALASRREEGALPRLTSVPEDVDLEGFRPVLLEDDAVARALSLALGFPVADARAELAPRRASRARRLALEALRAKPSCPLSLEGRCAGPTFSVVLDGVGEAVVGLPLPESRTPPSTQLLLEGRVALELSPSPYPVVVRASLARPDVTLSPALDALTPEGHLALVSLLDRVLPGVLSWLVQRARQEAPPEPSAGALVAAWLDAQATSGLLDPELRRALARAPLWLTPQGGRASAQDCLTRSGARKVLYTTGVFSPWRPPLPEDRKRDVPVVQVPPGEDGDRWARALTVLTTFPASDATVALARVQRERRLRLRDSTLVALTEPLPEPRLSGRIETLLPSLGVGELRVVPPGVIEGLTLQLHVEAEPRRQLHLAAPVALAAALETSRIDPEAIDTLTSAACARLRDDVLEAAHGLLERALEDAAPLPSWALPALRWHALTGDALSPGRLRRALFLDTAGAPMCLEDLDAQRSLHGAVAYVTVAPEQPLSPRQPGRRVVVLDPKEVAHLTSQREGLDYARAFLEEQRATEFERSAPSRVIAVTGQLPLDTVRRTLSPATHLYEGEVALLPRGDCQATVEWYHHRRRLGESTTPSHWPARLALEVPTLSPDALYREPRHDAVWLRALADAVGLVQRALEEHLRPPEDALCAAPLDAPGSPALSAEGPRAMGALWLLRDVRVGATLSVRVSSEQGPAWRSPMVSTASGSPVPIPLAGALWLRARDVPNAASRDQLVASLVGWAHARFLDELVTLEASEATRDAALAHLTLAALDGLLNSQRTRGWARTAVLPGSITTFWALRNVVEARRTLKAVPPDDPRLRTETGLIPRGSRPWQAVLRARGLVQDEAPPPEREVTPPSQPGARPAPALEDEVLSALARYGLPRDALRTVRVEGGRAKSAVSFHVRTSTATLYPEHPTVAALLAGERPRAVRALAVAVLGEVNRALREVTDADEERLIEGLLTELGEG